MTSPTLQAELELILANAMITAQVEPWNDGRTLTTALKSHTNHNIQALA